MGNHYELGIINVNFTERGWYRCVQWQAQNQMITSIKYFLDVVNPQSIKMVKNLKKKKLIFFR